MTSTSEESEPMEQDSSSSQPLDVTFLASPSMQMEFNNDIDEQPSIVDPNMHKIDQDAQTNVVEGIVFYFTYIFL